MNLAVGSIVVAIHGILLGLALVKIKIEEQRPYLNLSTLLLLLSFILFTDPNTDIFPEILAWEISSVFYFLLGPVFLSAIASISGNVISDKIKIYFLLPAVISLFILIISHNNSFYNFAEPFVDFFYKWNWMFSAFIEAICIFYSYRLVTSSKEKIENFSAGNEVLLSGKLYALVIVYFLIFLIDFSLGILDQFLFLSENIILFSPAVLSSFWFSYLAYQLIVDPQKFEGYKKTVLEPIEKYQKTGLTEFEANGIFSRAESLMESENFFLNQNCTLSYLAEKLCVTTHDLSQSLNSNKINFAGFINRFRVEYSKKLLADPEHCDKNILEISHLSGFSSKATFNRVFKETTGETPTSFRKNSSV